MQTKSNIQLIKEAIALKESAMLSLNNLMDKYTIEDSVFTFNNGLMYECTDGYFEVVNEYDNISEAVRNTDIKTQAIRVINNSSFQVGMVHSILSECSADNKVFDLKRLESVR
jgi:hypothetical protein